jgi:hypothetical protein
MLLGILLQSVAMENMPRDKTVIWLQTAATYAHYCHCVTCCAINFFCASLHSDCVVQAV